MNNFFSAQFVFIVLLVGDLATRRGRGRGRGRRNNKGGDCDTPRSANKRGNRQSGIGSTASLQSSSNSPLKGERSVLTSV